MRVQKKVSLDTPLAANGKGNIHSRILGCYFDTICNLFTKKEADLIRGRLRAGDLSIATDTLVTSKLDVAKRTGNLTKVDFEQLYQFSSFMKKLPEKGSEDLCMANAFSKLIQGEESCSLVNRTIDIRKGIDFPLFDRVSRIIEDILGPLPQDFLNTDVFFGPGSTVNPNNRSFEETGLFYKLSDRLIVPHRAKYYLAAHLSYNPNWVDTLGSHYHTQQNADESRLSFEMRVFNKHFEVVDNDHPSRIGFVPKNADEHRTIGIEMNGLMPLQKVIGNLIRTRLKQRTPIDLNSQQRNRHLARLAQTFELSTIDLANASSSISLELVRALLPTDWFTAINDFRSSHGQCNRIDSDVIEYEMVSSMGNGFTFELESLIFYALAVAIAERNGLHASEIKKSIGVFGDDIIVPRRISGDLITGMSLFGFTANIEKSFVKGFFFESCGADYYNCSDVRPFLLRREVKTFRDLLFLMNSILYKGISQCRSDFSELYIMLFKLIPDKSLLGPLHFDSKETREYGLDKQDDLEAVLRVPLEFARKNGAVSFDTTLFAWRFKKWIRVSLEAPLGKSKCYAVQHMRYLTFLRGNQGGKVLLRGRTSDRLKTCTTSQWDGVLTAAQLRIVQSTFSSLRLC